MPSAADKVAAILRHHARHQEGEAAIQVHDLPLTTLQHKAACRVLCQVGCQWLDKQNNGNQGYLTTVRLVREPLLKVRHVVNQGALLNHFQNHLFPKSEIPSKPFPKSGVSIIRNSC